jgi:hypothetical protein
MHRGLYGSQAEPSAEQPGAPVGTDQDSQATRVDVAHQ